MKTRAPLIAVTLLTLAIATACDRRENTDTAATADATADTATASDAATANSAAEPATDAATGTASAATDDSLALGLLAAVNDHEIKAAEQALSKQVSAPVMDYARMMQKEHGENQTATRALGTPADTAEVQAMKEKSANELAELGKQSGNAYETAYVDAMVKGHTEALALIDGRLLSLSSAGPVRDHLTKTREHVAMHLEAARKLQGAPSA